MLKEVEHFYLKEALEIDPGKKDVKGDDKKDQNKDGKNNFKDVMIARMIESGMSKEEAEEYVENKYKVKPKVKVNEGFSNWRTDLREVLDDLEADIEASQIKKKNVNNYKGKTINLNPTLGQVAENFGGEILDECELNEEYIDTAIEIATNYFIEQGLNEDGVELVVEEVGLDTFVDFVFDLAEDYILSEARRGPGGTKSRIEVLTTKGEKFKKTKQNPKGIPSQKSIESLRKKKQARRDAEEKESQNKPSGLTAALKRQNDVGKKVRQDEVNNAARKATGNQSEKKPNLSNISAKVSNAVNLARETGNTMGKAARGIGSAWQGVADSKLGQVTRVGFKKAADKARKDIVTTGAALGRAAGTVAKEKKQGSTTTSALGKGIKAGIGRLFNDFDGWVGDLISEGYDLSEYSELDLKIAYLEEKAVSEQQQKLFGAALAYKRKETTNVSDEVKKLANSMSEKELIKYASTKHKDVPKRV